DGQEARVAERELVRVAREQVEPDRDDRVHGAETRQEHEVARRGPRPCQQRQEADGERRAPHQTFRLTVRPTTPPGRTRRIAISSREGPEYMIPDGR